jgi:DNA polymerase III delta prime subunit
MENQVRMESIVNDTNVRYELWGQPAIVKAMKEDIDKLGFKKSEDDVEISWVFSDAQGNVQSFNVPLLIPDVVNGAYPWLNTSLETYVKNYMQSRASILILIGPPGTGKTTFIKELIRASKKDCMVTYDTKLLFQDSFFASFMSGGDDLLVLEDADEIMGSRRDGNSLMHRFLSASDGLISGRGKKIIFTTNLPSVRDVDSALIRPGRCYDILATRKLTLAECKVITSGLGKSEIDEGLTNSDLSLAELFALINKREEEKISVKEITSKRVGNPVGFFG